jgi:hypothetical protein
MRLKEIFEAITTVGSTTEPIQPTGLPKTGTLPVSTGTVSGSTSPTVSGTPPASNPTTPQVGQPMGDPAMQQSMKTTMADLDKIAAQIIGLKQKQQQMQQQMQRPPL